jgi:hypothetical protein
MRAAPQPTRRRTPHSKSAIALTIALLVVRVSWAAPQPLDVELEELRPGLVALYRSVGEKEAALTRIDAKPAFHIGEGSPHPRVPAGPFEVIWHGVLLLMDPGPINLDAYQCGELTVEVDGAVVLNGRGDS